MNGSVFWLKNPCVLLTDFDIIPTCTMTVAERLNAATRLLLLWCAGMYALGNKNTYLVLGLGLLIILVLYGVQSKEKFTINEQKALDTGIRGFTPGYDSVPHGPADKACWFDQDTDLLNALYEVTPMIQFNHDDAAKRSYSNAKYEVTPLTHQDGYTEIWRNEPGMCGEYTMTPDPLTTFPVEDSFGQGQCNYIVRSNIDHIYDQNGSNGLNSLRAIAEDGYMQSMLDYRQGIMNNHIDRFRRERQHNCADMPISSLSAGGGGTI